MPGLSSVIARKSPSANERRTVSVAKTNVQTKTRRNGLRIERVVKTLLKFARPTYVFQPGSSSSPLAGDERALAVVAEDLAVLDPHERVRSPGRSGASARARARVDALGPDRASPVGRDREARRARWSSASSSGALDELVALGATDRAELVELQRAPCRQRLEPLLRARRTPCPSPRRRAGARASPSASRAGAITYGLPSGRLAERVDLDRRIASSWRGCGPSTSS